MTPQPLTSYYHQTTTAQRMPYAKLQGSHRVDVCVVGGGIAGCSTALHLAQRGYRVALLEAHSIGFGASGRNGGQVLPGFSCDQDRLEKLVGARPADQMWQLSVEAVQLVRSLIAQHAINCDWQSGFTQVANKPRHVESLRAWHDTLQARYNYRGTRLMTAVETQQTIASNAFCAGLHDAHSGHLNPLLYTLGLANAASNASAMLYEQSAVIEINNGNPVRLRTATGEVLSDLVVLCGNAYLGTLQPSLRKRIMSAATYMIATEPLGETRAHSLIHDNSCVSDCNFILDYFRRSADHRLLFGGRLSYSGHDTFNSTTAMRQRMLRVFPQLRDIKVEHSWNGLLDLTLNRAPDFGRIGDRIYYLQGFAGHGIALTTLAGQLIARALAKQNEQFDLFANIPHHNFPGGPLRKPLFVIAMLWYRLRDWL